MSFEGGKKLRGNNICGKRVPDLWRTMGEEVLSNVIVRFFNGLYPASVTPCPGVHAVEVVVEGQINQVIINLIAQAHIKNKSTIFKGFKI